MDTKQIKALMREFDESGLSKLKISKEDGFSIEMEKNIGVMSYAPVAAAPVQSVPTLAAQTTVSESTAAETISGDTINSPMVGTYYSSPSPDSPSFVKVGDRVKKGQPLAILEAMKIMNELEAEFDCKIIQILAESGQPVEFDMPLFVVERV
jgi:acetyl-CoA carboxylase biotin carboxyl carrier protein